MERRLGRGLGSLLGGSGRGNEPSEGPPPRDEGVTAEEPKREEERIPVDRIRPNPHQPRVHFDAEQLEELVASIRQHGVLQPICVREADGGGYELISGERRWRSAKIVGLERIPAVVRQGVSDDQMLELALVENVQRQDLDAIEKAKGYRDLMVRLGKTQKEVADQVGKKRSTVANHLRLLDLPAPVQDGISKGLLSMGHARALLGLGKDTRGVLKLFEKAVRENLSVRQVEEAVKQSSRAGVDQGGATKNKEATQTPAWVKEIESRIQNRLGIRCQLRNPGKAYRGQIVLHYHDRAELDRLIDQLAPEELLE